MSNKLPQKENGIFKKLVKSYEYKQYKNGLKFAKQILSNPKFSEHGETLVMKGLILNCLGRKEEAYEHVKKGLKNDIKSHVCWHVYGLLQRSDKKYDEAIKCYRNALKWDKDNIQILRDLSLLQIQMRDLEGFRDTRYQLLKSRPTQRSSWVGYAISFHLLEDFEMALKVMAEYRKAQPLPQTQPDYEFSEMVLYEVQLLMEGGMIGKAISHLEEFKEHISDDLTFTETMGDVLLKQGKRGDAELIYRQLLQRNPENYEYYENLEKCLDLPTPEDKVGLYTLLKQTFPRSHVCRRIPLAHAKGSTFQDMIDSYIAPSLHKGVPSLFMGLKKLYSDPEKATVIGSTVHGYLSSLESSNRFHEAATDEPDEPPTALLWTLFFLSQHYDQLGEHQRALDYINRAIMHTPTHIELYMFKSKIYKHAGDLLEAARWMDEARKMDTADRFVNCKCVKYLLKTNQTEEAIKTAGLFTREGLSPLQTMDDMQCMWFQSELARAYRRTGRLGEALVVLHEMDQHFTDMIEDQFDFHTYCMRKMTLRAYVGVIRLEDKLRSHRFYCDAAKDAIELYIYLHDNPDAAKESPSNDNLITDNSHLSASERKKLARKQRKAQARAQAKAQEEKKENRPHGKTANTDDDKKSQEDQKNKLDPKELLTVQQPLGEALKFLAPLLNLSSDKIETHFLAYAVHSRRRKYLLMLKALKKAHSLDSNSPQLHANLIDFLRLLKSEQQEFSPPVKTVIDSILPTLTERLSPEELNSKFISRHSSSLDHMITGAHMMYKLNPDNQSKALDLIRSLYSKLDASQFKMCLKIQNLLIRLEFGYCPDALQDFEKHCHKLFPLATAFKPPPPAADLIGEMAAVNLSEGSTPPITDSNESKTTNTS